ncbi:MAG: hypothetical protein SH857_17400 [Chitinophagales bacterium]|nr:hypothetical protein [Chitinophagales bacterium]
MKNSFPILFIGRTIVLVAFVLCAYASSFAQAVVYDLFAADLTDWDMSGPGCVTWDDRYTCGQPVSLSWTSTGTYTVTSATIEFYETYGFNGAVGTTLNGVANNNYVTSNSSMCDPIVYTYTLDTAGYVVGGLNTFTIAGGVMCLVIDQNAAWSNAYARVTITYGSAGGPPTWTGDANWTDNPNWTNGSPIAADSVVVQSGTLTVDTDVTVTDLTLENGATLIVEPGNTLTITGDYLNNGGTFTVQTGGELAFRGLMKKNGATKARNYGILKVKSGAVRLGN